MTKIDLETVSFNCLMAIPDPIFIANDDERIVFVNTAAQNLFGGDSTGLEIFPLLFDQIVSSTLRRSLEDSGAIVVSPSARIWGSLEAMRNTRVNERKPIVERIKLRFPGRDMDAYDVRICGSWFETSKGTSALIITLVEIQSLIRDGLTGLCLRETLDDVLERELSRRGRSIARGQEAHPLSLAMLDVDHFKKVNDIYGHQVGDAVLRKIAKTIGKAMQRKEDFVARYGGEEIVIVLPGTGLEEAIDVANRVRAAISEIAVTSRTGQRLTVTASLGVSVTLPGIDTAEDLIRRADAALYEAKRTGRNRVCYAIAKAA